MKKLLFTLVACIAALSANAWTVYFSNPSNWATPHIWAWNGSNNLSGDKWPGNAMTKTSNGLWYYTGTGNPAKIKFNDGKENGASESNEFDFVDGATYNSSTGMIVDGGYYIIGLNNKWEPNDQSTPMVRNPDDPSQFMYTFTSAQSGKEFKIAPKTDSKWATIWGPSSGNKTTLVAGDNDLATNKDGNLVVPTISGNNTVTIYFKPNWNDKQLWVVINTVSEPEPAGVMALIVATNNNTWDPSQGVYLTKTGEGVFKGEVTLGNSFGDVYFGIAEKLNSNWNNLGTRYEAEEDNFDIGLNNTEYTIKKYSSGYAKNFKVDAGRYNVEININTNKIKLECLEAFKPSSYSYPSKIYLIGHIKGATWESADEYSSTGNDGVYKFKSVSIYGGEDNKADGNYFGFFGGTKKFNSEGNFDYEQLLPRFVCDPSEVNDGASNVFISDSDFKNAAETGVVKKVHPHSYNRTTAREFNFKVDEGYYDITLDLKKWEMTIQHHTPVVFDWHDATNEVLAEENQDKHEIEFGPNAKIQVGVEGDAKHDAANKAAYRVWYSPLTASASGIKARRAGENDGSSEGRMTEITDPQGEEVTNNTEYYSVDNKSVITFNKAGVYEIEASLPEKYDEIYPEATGNAIVLTVNQANVKLVKVAEKYHSLHSLQQLNGCDG